MIYFDWDENKNSINKDKHGISFEEAQTAFYDSNALIIDDPDHSDEEDRYILLGFSIEANLLVVVHCYRSDDSIIRIISARKATKNEARKYADNLERW